MALTQQRDDAAESNDGDATTGAATPVAPDPARQRTGGRHAASGPDDGGRHAARPSAEPAARHAEPVADDHEPEHLIEDEPARHWHHRIFTPYALGVMFSLLALCPFIVLTTATSALNPLIGKDLHASQAVLSVGSGLANAGYALGAVVAADLAQRIVQRYLFLVYEAVFVVASVIAALAPNGAVFVLGHTLQGVATGLLLVGALPPLILRFPPARLPLTVAFVSIGLFGATALGPFLGDVLADVGTWRWLFVAAAALGALGWLTGWIGYEVFPPFNPDLPIDKYVFPLAIGATFLPFLGSALAMSQGFASPWFWAPIAVGVLALLAMLTVEYRSRDPLMPMKTLSSSLPVSGTLGAMLGGAAFVAAVSLISLAMEQRGIGLVTAGLYLLPLVLGVAVSSILFKHYIVRAALPMFALSGLIAIVVGIAVALPITWSGGVEWTVPVSAVLLGFGAGSAVAPALFLAGMGVESKKIGRAFAMIELLRSEAAFLVAPVLVVLATHVGGLSGLRETLLISLVVALGGLLIGVAVYVGSGTRRHAPHLDEWLLGDDPALHSPRVFARLRGLPTD